MKERVYKFMLGRKKGISVDHVAERFLCHKTTAQLTLRQLFLEGKLRVLRIENRKKYYQAIERSDMKRWCPDCKTTNFEREGGVSYDEQNRVMCWLCNACTRRAKVSGRGRVRSLASILDEEGSGAVDAVLHEATRIAQNQTS